MSWLNCLRFSMSCCFSPLISMSWFLVLESRCRGFLVLESQCRGFLVLESRCRGFLVLESCCLFRIMQSNLAYANADYKTT